MKSRPPNVELRPLRGFSRGLTRLKGLVTKLSGLEQRQLLPSEQVTQPLRSAPQPIRVFALDQVVECAQFGGREDVLQDIFNVAALNLSGQDRDLAVYLTSEIDGFLRLRIDPCRAKFSEKTSN